MRWLNFAKTPAPLWDAHLSAAVVAVFVNPALFKDFPQLWADHPLLQAAAIAQNRCMRFTAAQKEEIFHWFSGHAATLRMLLRADFFSSTPSVALSGGSELIGELTARLSQEIPQLKFSPDFAICACLTTPEAILDYPEEIQVNEGVLVRVLESAAFTAAGEWPNLAHMGAWQLWERLPLRVKQAPSARRALVFHLQKEQSLAPSQDYPEEIRQLSQQCPIVRSWVGVDPLHGG